MGKSPEETLASMIANLKESTGKTLEQWVRISAATKLGKHKALVDHLKAEYGIGHGYANLIAQTALKPADAPADADDLVEAQYAGAKAALRPIYDALLAALRKLGNDVEVAPKKAYVSLRRSKQFAIIQPSTATRVDVGINLKGVQPAGRLEASGSFNSMVTHRVRLSSVADVESEVVGWLKRAYDAA